jgi:hypothetical protein
MPAFGWLTLRAILDRLDRIIALLEERQGLSPEDRACLEKAIKRLEKLAAER